MPEVFINHNGSLRNEKEAVFMASNRGYRYGIGIFETMHFDAGTIRLAALHFERLYSGLNLLQLNVPAHWNADYFLKQVKELIHANQLTRARVRLSISGGKGNLHDFDSPAEYLIEATPVQLKTLEPIRLGVYTDDWKTAGKFSNLKSSVYLLNTMAMHFGISQNWDDVLILNHHGRICESAISNVFWLKDGNVHTVPLSEGPVAGVMRRHIIETLPSLGYKVFSSPIECNSLLEADEIFLTNAIQVIRPVAEFQGKRFATSISEKIYSLLFSTKE